MLYFVSSSFNVWLIFSISCEFSDFILAISCEFSYFILLISCEFSDFILVISCIFLFNSFKNNSFFLKVPNYNTFILDKKNLFFFLKFELKFVIFFHHIIGR